jgi:hypothetical protein
MATETEIYYDGPARRVGKKRVAVSKEESTPSAMAIEAEVEEQVSAVAQLASGGEVTVRVVRIPANPRLLLCESQESECRRILVRVRSNVKFRRGMELAAVPSASESEPWSYSGALPRFAGRW